MSETMQPLLIDQQLVIDHDLLSDTEDLTSNSFHSDSTTRISASNCHAYKRRFWILYAFSIAALTQGLLWTLWSPINFAVNVAFGWTAAVAGLITASSNIAYLLLALPVMYLVEQQGLQIGMMISGVCLVAQMCCWVLALPTVSVSLTYIGGAFNGVAAVTLIAAPALISATWFPTRERTTATSVITTSAYLGGGIGFIAGPYISGPDVTPEDIKINEYNHTEGFQISLQHGIQNVMYFGAGLAVLSLMGILIYFPDRPPKPPSHSAYLDRMNFRRGLLMLFKNRTFWFLLIAYNLPNMTFNAWMPLLSRSFITLGVTEKQAGWCGFISIVGSCVSSIVMSIFVDRFKRKMKVFVTVTTALSILTFSLILFIAERYIVVRQNGILAALYTLGLVAGVSINAPTPIYYELMCECSYPVHEGLTIIISAMFSNLGGTILFLLLQVDSLAADTIWMLWLIMVFSIISLPLILLSKVNFHRLDADNE